MKFTAGDRVAYVGSGRRSETGLGYGDTGEVLASTGTGASYVMWDEGPLGGRVLLVGNYNLVAAADVPVVDEDDDEPILPEYQAALDHTALDHDGSDSYPDELHPCVAGDGMIAESLDDSLAVPARDSRTE